MHLCFEPHTRLATHIQRANAFGAVGLVRRKTHEVDLGVLQVDVHLAGALRRIHVQQDAAGPGDLANGGNVGDGANLVVHVHQRDQNGVVTQGRFHRCRMDQAGALLGVEIGHLESFALELAAGVQHRLVLDLRGNDVLALALIEVGGALDGQVVGFGCARGPHDLARVGVDQIRHLATGGLHRFFRLPAIQV